MGGDRPSQTTRLPRSPGRIHSPGLEPQHCKGGISPMTPQDLATLVHSLPPILHMLAQKPMPSCSKGARGLSVLLRVCGIFTATTVSPSLSPRQSLFRYKIRAGRNLPDKEFRYLRTVIVTADIHRGFGSELRTAEAELTPCLNLSALVTCHTLYVLLRVSRVLCFC